MTAPSPETRPPAPRWVTATVRAALVLAFAAPLLVLAGAVGTKLGLWDWRTGFITLTIGAAPKAAMLGVVTGLIALVAAGVARRLPLVALAGVAFVMPLAVLGAFAAVKAKAGAVPPIHDYATNWAPPPMPSPTLAAARGPGANPVETDPRMKRDPARPEVENWADDRIARIGAEACPAARPVTLALAPAQAAERVRRVLDDAGLAVTSPGSGDRVEATASTFWYGFKDDVIARLRPEGTGTRVDLRSVSRVGQSDLGANCTRLTKLVAALGDG